MIQLRWLQLMDCGEPTENVLQYRQEIRKVDYSTDDGYDYIGWSEWIDVPTVTENG